MVRRVDIKYKNKFWHKCCFSLLVLSVKSKLYRCKNEFRHKACFSLLVLSVRNSNCDMSHIPNSQLKIQIIAEHTQPQRVDTAANYKVLHNHISAQLLLSKHRHSKKPTGAKSQPVTSQGYLQSKDIDRILGIYSFRDLLAGMKFKMIQICHVRTTEER